jgi:hypothetical protein
MPPEPSPLHRETVSQTTLQQPTRPGYTIAVAYMPALEGHVVDPSREDPHLACRLDIECQARLTHAQREIQLATNTDASRLNEEIERETRATAREDRRWARRELMIDVAVGVAAVVIVVPLVRMYWKAVGW